MRINGIVCFYKCKDISKKIKIASEFLKHRAKKGYLISYKDLSFEELDLKIESKFATLLSLREDGKGDELAHFIGKDFEELKLKELIDSSLSEANIDELALKLKKIRAHYSFAYSDSRGLIFCRDNLGVKPLYLGKKEDEIILATEKKVLKALEFEDIKPVKPNTLFLISDSKRIFKEIDSWENEGFKGDFQEAKRELLHQLTYSINNFNYEGLALAFSGGIDSLILAKLISKYQRISLFSLCFKGGEEERWIDKASEYLNLELKKYYINEEIVKNLLSFIEWLIERSKPMDLAIGLGFYLISKFASLDNLDKLVLGQLADEEFGGYKRYLNYYLKGNDPNSLMFKDIVEAHELTFSRDDLSCSPFMLPIFPYANFDIVKLALSIPPEFKFEKDKRIRKLILREVAKDLGIDEVLVYREKKAFQYSTKLENMVKKYLAYVS